MTTYERGVAAGRRLFARNVITGGPYRFADLAGKSRTLAVVGLRKTDSAYGTGYRKGFVEARRSYAKKHQG